MYRIMTQTSLSANGRSQRQTMVGLRSLKSPLQEEEEQQALRWTDLEDESEVADLREEKADVHELRSVLAQSDMEVGQRLSKFVPDKDKVTVQMNFEAQHASSQAAVRASRTALRTSKSRVRPHHSPTALRTRPAAPAASCTWSVSRWWRRNSATPTICH